MKLFILLNIIGAIKALSLEEEWNQFKINFNKTYENLEDESVRFKIFENNFKLIQEHNVKHKKGLKTYWLGINKFSDLNSEEFKKIYLGYRYYPRSGLTHVHNESLTVPESIDWREKNAVMEVKDQSVCGGCWAFSTTGVIEGQNAILRHQKVSLSEQHLIECSTENYGCNGGTPERAYQFVIRSGLDAERDYPFNPHPGKCHPRPSVVRIKDHRKVAASEAHLKDAVGTIGPISIAMYAGSLQHYAGGIYYDEGCISDIGILDHAVLAVGYGVSQNKKYWLIKNSWGTSWGENGYLRLLRDADQCGVYLDATYPIL